MSSATKTQNVDILVDLDSDRKLFDLGGLQKVSSVKKKHYRAILNSTFGLINSL